MFIREWKSLTAKRRTRKGIEASPMSAVKALHILPTPANCLNQRKEDEDLLAPGRFGLKLNLPLEAAEEFQSCEQTGTFRREGGAVGDKRFVRTIRQGDLKYPVCVRTTPHRGKSHRAAGELHVSPHRLSFPCHLPDCR